MGTLRLAREDRITILGTILNRSEPLYFWHEVYIGVPIIYDYYEVLSLWV